jgi:hypothetical protein
MRLIPTSITQKTVDPNDPTGGMTLDALMLRQKQLMQSRPEVPNQIASPLQGAALMANTLVNSLGQVRAQRQEAAGRDLMAQTIAGIDPVKGATPEQQATMMRLDPDTSMKYIADAMQARRAQIQQEHQDALTREGWSHQDAEALAARTASEALTREGWQHQDVSQAATLAHEDTSQQAGFTHADTAAETARQAQAAATEKEHQYQESQPQTDVGKLDADLKAGRITQDEYAAKITQMRPDQYRPLTPEEYKTWNIPVGPDGQPTQPYRMNIKENKPEAVGNTQLLPAEVGGRIGMSDSFMSTLPAIRTDIEKGALSGATNRTLMVAGQGRPGEINRQIQTGIDALIRGLTGSGMGEAEANKYAKRYQPGLIDTDQTINSKLDGLERELHNVRSTVGYGRSLPAEPGATSQPPPPPDQYTVGKTYKDDQGNSATYLGGGKWQEVK